jgi:hypothetical protein
LDMPLAAVEVADAADHDGMTLAFVALTKTCVDCHTRRRAPSMPVVGPRDLDSGVPAVGHGLKDAKALHQMWSALVSRSDAEWREGARVLSSASVPTTSLSPGRTAPAPIDDFATSIRRNGARAISESDVATRVTIFGHLLTSCVGCHARGRPPYEQSLSGRDR